MDYANKRWGEHSASCVYETAALPLSHVGKICVHSILQKDGCCQEGSAQNLTGHVGIIGDDAVHFADVAHAAQVFGEVHGPGVD